MLKTLGYLQVYQVFVFFSGGQGGVAVNFSNNQEAMSYIPFFKKHYAVLYSSVFFVIVFEDLTIRKELWVYNMIAEINKLPDFREEFEFHILRF